MFDSFCFSSVEADLIEHRDEGLNNEFSVSAGVFQEFLQDLTIPLGGFS